MVTSTPHMKIASVKHHPKSEKSKQFVSTLKERREGLKSAFDSHLTDCESAEEARDAMWKERSFPVLSILAPAMISHEGNIEYPGDPVCLYAGISKMISGVEASLNSPFSSEDGYHDYCPQLGRLPDIHYRLQQGNSTKRTQNTSWDKLNTDQTVFDPRAWNEDTKSELLTILKERSPVVVLISSVSCAHRYALAIAREVKKYSPSTIVVLGGRHADETVQYDPKTDLVTYSYSSTVRSICDGRTSHNIDFIVSRDGAYCLDYLMKALSLAFDPVERIIDRASISDALQHMAREYHDVRGQSILTWLTPEEPKPILFQGSRYTLSDIPHIYHAFAIRAHFPIFTDHEDKVLRTAHVLTTDACPYQCSFCSEGIGVMGRMNKLSRQPAETMIERVKQLADYGAGSLFFDDSVMFGGNMVAIRQFSFLLAELKEGLSENALAEAKPPDGILTETGLANICKMQWGAQLTGEFLSTFQTEERAREMLSLMARSGCTYIYFGIESLSETIISGVHKHRNEKTNTSWINKIRKSLRIVKSVGIRVGSSVLFGLEGETRDTIDETIIGIEALIDEGLLDLASPNIMTYHPGTEITRLHQMDNKLDYHSPNHDVRPPYSYFEQAFPGVVSKHLNEQDIWYIHQRANERWGNVRNSNESTQYYEANYANV